MCKLQIQYLGLTLVPCLTTLPSIIQSVIYTQVRYLRILIAAECLPGEIGASNMSLRLWKRDQTKLIYYVTRMSKLSQNS